MKTAWAFVVSLAVCLPCASSPAAEPEVLASWETLASQLQKSVDHYDAGDFERSLQAAKDALTLLNGQSAVAYNNICSAQMKLGAYDEAALACSKALELVPGYRRALDNLAWVYERVIEQSPTVGAYLNLSVVRYWQDDLAESDSAARKVLQLDPDNAVAHNNLCAAFAKRGEWKRAIRECERALEIDADYQLAKNNLAWAQAGKSD